MPRSSRKLETYFSEMGGVLVAFSGGVDSSVLAKAAKNSLGRKALAVTFDTPTLARRELASARRTAKRIGIRHRIVKYDDLMDRRFRKNPSDRCYHCKKRMAAKLLGIAARGGWEYIVEGTNAHDLLGHRPGYKALQEAGILSPFVELGFDKALVRRLAKEYRLDWDKPSGACLASRIPTGTAITKKALSKVERAEDFLKSIGLTQVRVRVEGDYARIEAYSDEFPMIIANCDRIARALPFKRVALDLKGYPRI